MVYKDVDPISQVTVLEAQWTNLPEDVVEEVRRMWRNLELFNDFAYVSWSEDDFYTAENDPDSEWGYPRIAEYLRSRGIEECLIHYWW